MPTAGRWHLGMATDEYLPENRGFSSFLGYLNGGEVSSSRVTPRCHDYVTSVH